ncbi:MAG: magnesium chelatase, partial [Candidatus Poseidoniia archaeon]
MSEDSETGEEQESSVSQTYLMDEDLRATRELAEGLLGEVEKVVMGKRPVLELVMTGILAGGNIL